MLRFSLVISLLGIIMQAFALLLGVPFAVSLLYKEYDTSQALLCCMFFAFILGYIAKKSSNNKNFDDLGRVEGMAVVAVVWLLAALLGAMPYMFFGFEFIDAFFEAMSGFTTTGATTMTDFSRLNASMFFYRGYTHWVGGMGILVLFVAVLPYLAVSGRQLFSAETSSVSNEKLSPRVVYTARRLWSWYLFLTLLQSLLLYYAGMSPNDAIANSFATMAAGGFSPNSKSIMGYQNPFAEWVIIVFMFLSGANFTLQVNFLRGKYTSLLKNAELRLYVTIITLSSIALMVLLYRGGMANDSILGTLRTALFQNISVMTTTGFASVDFDLWLDSAKVILLVLMFIGGCSGSAGGGIKVIRLLIMLRYLGRNLLKAIYPEMVVNLKLGDRRFTEPEIQPVLAFIALYFLFFFVGGTFAAIIENNIVLGYTGSIATLGNIGPGFGNLGPMGNFQQLHFFTKVIFSVLMWVGRLEIMAFAVFLRREVWANSKW